MKTTTNIAIASAGILAALTFTAVAQTPTLSPAVPSLINYQGFVTDNASVPLGDTTPTNFDVLFKIYDAGTGGDLIWGEMQTVTIAAGQFSVLLGNGTAIDQNTPHGDLSALFGPGGTAVDTGSVFLGVTVDNLGQTAAAEFTPRQQLVANPFALRAKSADVAQTVAAGGVTGSSFAAGSVSGGDAGPIADGSITAADLGANSVAATQIADGAVTNAKIANGAVNNSKILNNAVNGAKIQDNSIGAADIAANAVGASEIATNAVGFSEIASNAVGFSEMANDAVGWSELRGDHSSLHKMTLGRFTSTAPARANGIALNNVAVFAGQWNGSFHALEGGSGAAIQHTSSGQLVRNSSSRRYKENIRPLEQDFRKILEIEPKLYNRRQSPDQPEIGFIAEELDELGLDHLVIRDLEGRADAITYDKISIYLLQVAKQQQATVETLEQQNAELIERLERLEKKL